MPQLRPLDPEFPIERQIPIDAAPAILVNVFTLDIPDEPAFLQAWQEDAAFMKRQPGFISTQLHRAIGARPTYLNYAVWGVDCPLPGGVHAPGVQGEAQRVSGVGGRVAAPVPEGRGAGNLRGVSGGAGCAYACRAVSSRMPSATNSSPLPRLIACTQRVIAKPR